LTYKVFLVILKSNGVISKLRVRWGQPKYPRDSCTCNDVTNY